MFEIWKLITRRSGQGSRSGTRIRIKGLASTSSNALWRSRCGRSRTTRALKEAWYVQQALEHTGAFGFNARTEIYEDLSEAGVIDPTKVVRTAIENAGSIAGLLLTTEALITEKPEEKTGRGNRSRPSPRPRPRLAGFTSPKDDRREAPDREIRGLFAFAVSPDTCPCDGLPGRLARAPEMRCKTRLALRIAPNPLFLHPVVPVSP